eukprot:7378900-Prymnesium_polylepis.1
MTDFGSPIRSHQPSHCSILESETCEEVHGFANWEQKEQLLHLQSVQCGTACCGLQKVSHDSTFESS